MNPELQTPPALADARSSDPERRADPVEPTVFSVVRASDEERDAIRDACYDHGLDFETTLWVLRWTRSCPGLPEAFEAVGGSVRDLVACGEMFATLERRGVNAADLIAALARTLGLHEGSDHDGGSAVEPFARRGRTVRPALSRRVRCRRSPRTPSPTRPRVQSTRGRALLTSCARLPSGSRKKTVSNASVATAESDSNGTPSASIDDRAAWTSSTSNAT